MYIIKCHYLFLLRLCLIGGLWTVQAPSTSDIVQQKYLYFFIRRMIAFKFVLQLFRNRKPAVSISMESPSMMSLVDGV